MKTVAIFLLIVVSLSSCRSVEKMFAKNKSKQKIEQQKKSEFKNVSKVENNTHTVKRDTLKSLLQKTYERRITIDGITVGPDGQRFWDSLHKSVSGAQLAPRGNTITFGKITIDENRTDTENKENLSTTEQKATTSRQEEKEGKNEEKKNILNEDKSVNKNKETKGMSAIATICLVGAGLLLVAGIILFLYLRAKKKKLDKAIQIIQ